jgi:hypothetical protein
MMMAMITCMSAADCSEGGSGMVCCFSGTTFSTSCVAGQCAMGDYTQCAGSDSECVGAQAPSGPVCMASPLGMGVHYCAPGDGGTTTSDGGTSDAGTGDGATE